MVNIAYDDARKWLREEQAGGADGRRTRSSNRKLAATNFSAATRSPADTARGQCCAKRSFKNVVDNGLLRQRP